VIVHRMRDTNEAFWSLLERLCPPQQVWRSQPAEAAMLDELLLPSWDTLPPEFRAARAHHVGIDPAHPPLGLLASMRAAASAEGGAPPVVVVL